MEDHVVTGIAADSGDVRVSISGLPSKAGIAYEIFGPIAEAAIVVDVIVQNSPEPEVANLSFTFPEVESSKVSSILEKQVLTKYPGAQISSEKGVAKVSVVGVGMHNHPGVASKMFKTLGDAGISIKLISTSEIKISVLIDQNKAELAVQKLHAAFGLDAE